MKKFKLVVSAVLAVFLCITVAPAAFAMGANENVGEQIVTFSDFTQLAENECLEKSVIDSNGNMAVVGIERVADGRSVYNTGSTWRVWFTGVTINAEFYMSVFNRRICQVITPNPQSLYLQWFPALRSPAYSCLTLSKINRLREKQGKKG